MVLDPIDLLKQRLAEIEAVDCEDVDFLRHKLKYKMTIDFLNNSGYVTNKDTRYKISEHDRDWLRNNIDYGEQFYYANIFNISPGTLTSILKEKKAS